ncbi:MULTISPECIES: 23S rRNA (uracil(1939)-C(5))-methyltransferase RlmD [Rheinheimera]|uniref:23S rRNA (Uracil(1939)-C(5))-methyltransferase RlmD n=1 Tax=Rheinheimera marina TaxID=1774958 RepID=A0ABV9JJB5_9GAMM
MVKIYQAGKAKKSPANQAIQLKIDRLDHQGQGIGYWQGKIVFASGALPGETVDLQLTDTKSKVAKGKVRRVLDASPLRQQAACPHFANCGGCQLQYLSAEAQLELKQQAVDQMICHQTGLKDLPWQPAIRSAGAGYRRRARIGVWFDKQQQRFTVGFRQANDKTISAVAHCLVLSPVLAPVFSVLNQVLPQLKQGSAITHVEVLDADGQAYLIVRHIRALPESDQQLLLQAWPDAFWLGEAQPGEFTAWQADYRPPEYQLAEQKLRLQFEPDDFIQVNPEVNRQMVQQALDWLEPDLTQNILELYSGIGNFSLALAQRTKAVHALEGVATMVRRIEQNAQLNKISNLTAAQADLHLPWPKADWNQPVYDAVLLDPARAGAVGAAEQIAALGPARILYVSCNPVSFAADAKLFLAAGYQLVKLAAMDMFPQTSHLELMALFRRRK